MKYKITQLGKPDFDEAIDFSNMVFSMNGEPHDFPKLLPEVYNTSEKAMKCFYAIKDQGKIKALLAIYRSVMVIDGTRLKLAQIGGVATHPYYRGKGMMSALMEFAVKQLNAEKTDIALLGGQRDRYKYFGFEVCGTKCGYLMSPKSFKHSKLQANDITLEILNKYDAGIMKKLKTFNEDQDMYVEREPSRFLDICHTWSNDLHVARSGKEIVGYLVAGGKRTDVTEINAVSDEVKLSMLSAFSKGRLAVFSGDIKFGCVLDKYVESRWVDASGNWQVLNWSPVLTALLQYRNRLSELLHGKVLFGIKGFGNFQITVNEKKIKCSSVKKQAEYTFEPSLLHRIAFGPVPPYRVTDIPGSLNIFNHWFPLPLCISDQDHR